MLRLATAAAQGHHGSACCNCNDLPVGHLCGVPIRCSLFLLVYGLYSAGEMARLHAPWWVVIGMVVGSLAVLIATILVHEFGHGITAKRLGGSISRIHLGPMGGLCVLTMPEHGTIRQKLCNDWWVSLNGPCTHLIMTPAWIGVCALLFLAFSIRYTWSDLWRDLNPLDHASSLSRHHEVSGHGWGAVLLLHLSSMAISFNVLLFLFNLLFPMYPLDGSKLLVTGMQLCGTPVQKAAQRFIWISGTCVLLLLGFTAYQFYRFVSHATEVDLDHAMQRLGMGFIPLPFPILVSLGLGFWGGRQTWELYQLAEAQRLHSHPLFSHVQKTSRRVRDIANGRPDTFVEQVVDRYDGADPPPPPPPPPPQGQDYGAVRIVGGRIVRG